MPQLDGEGKPLEGLQQPRQIFPRVIAGAKARRELSEKRTQLAGARERVAVLTDLLAVAIHAAVGAINLQALLRQSGSGLRVKITRANRVGLHVETQLPLRCKHEAAPRTGQRQKRGE